MRGLIRAQLAHALRLAAVVVVGLGGLPLLFALAPERRRRPAVRHRAAVAAARRRRLPVPVRRRLASTYTWPSAPRREFTDLVRTARNRELSPFAVPAIVAVTMVTLAIGAYGLRAGPYDLGLPGRLPGGQSPTWNAAAISGEYLSAASLPRRGRADPQGRRGHALVPGRIRRRLSGPAAVRRGATAPLAARSHCRTSARRGCGSTAVCAGSRPCSWCLSAGSTCVPQLQGAGLTLQTVAGGPYQLGRGAGRRRGDRERGARRHAGDHLRAGLPVLVEADRARRAGDVPAAALAGATGGRRSAAPAGQTFVATADHGEQAIDPHHGHGAGVTADGSVDRVAWTGSPALAVEPGNHHVGPRLGADLPGRCAGAGAVAGAGRERLRLAAAAAPRRSGGCSRRTR